MGTTVEEVALGEHRRGWPSGERLDARVMRSQWEIVLKAQAVEELRVAGS